MPELPEVETVRTTLAAALAGATVAQTTVRRKSVWRGPGCPLRGGRVVAVRRHGKQLALVGEAGGVVCVHLGMSGRLCVYGEQAESASAGVSAARNGRPLKRTPPEGVALPAHTHVRWTLDDGRVLAFTDPRRFGGVWAFADAAALHDQRWSKLGPDATSISPGKLYAGLSRTRRGLKAALLDQAVVAGLGNIYVDELLFAARLPPEVPAHTLTLNTSGGLVRAMRRLLDRAVAAGGTTLRDYVDGNGAPGRFALQHKVYGRGGQPCVRCGARLSTATVAGRTTVWCATCQADGSTT